MQNQNSRQRFCLVLIKPSHYDDDGYVIQWFRSAIPSNSLACLYGLALECGENKILGENVDIEIHAFDETNTHINPKKIASLIEKADDGMVMLVGVQSNQFPRSLDIAKPLRERNIKVAIGGFHVSGTLAMLKARDSHVQKALDMGVSLFAGEAEGRLGQVLIDAAQNKLQPIYNYMDDLPNIEGVAAPILPADRVYRTAGANPSFDAGRGCPLAGEEGRFGFRGEIGRVEIDQVVIVDARARRTAGQHVPHRLVDAAGHEQVQQQQNHLAPADP